MNLITTSNERSDRIGPAGAEARPPANLAPERREAPGGDPSRGVDEHLVSLLTPNSFEAEQYRALRVLLEQKHRSESLGLIAVSSPVAGDGKTLTTINLAGALAQAPDARVLLVDADLRRPSVEACIGLKENGPGLVEAILDPGIALDRAVRRLPIFNLSVMPPGRAPASPYEILKSPRLGDLLQEARRRFDYVLIDTPPMVPVPDLRVIAKWVDGVLLVVSAHKTPRRLLEEAFYLADPAKIVGIVFNNDDRMLSRAYGYYDYGRPLNGADGSRRRRKAGRGSAS